MTYFLSTPAGQGSSYTRLHDATRRADKLATDQGVEVKVIHEETEVVVYLNSPARIRKETEGIDYNPMTRVEQPRHAAPEFAGYMPAYTRSRIQTTVYRKNDWERGGDNWRVFSGAHGRFVDVRDTKAACKITSAMAQGDFSPFL